MSDLVNLFEEATVQYLSPHDEYIRKDPAKLLINLSRRGVSSAQLDSLRHKTGLDLQSFATVLQVSPRTLQKKSGSDNMGLSVSEKAIQLARLFAMGEDIFGSAGKFTKWLKSNIPALGNVTPLSLLDTHFGFELVEAALGRMAHGILS